MDHQPNVRRIDWRPAASFAAQKLVCLDPEAADKRVVLQQTARHPLPRRVWLSKLARPWDAQGIKEGFDPVINIPALGHELPRQAGPQKKNTEMAVQLPLACHQRLELPPADLTRQSFCHARCNCVRPGWVRQSSTSCG